MILLLLIHATVPQGGEVPAVGWVGRGLLLLLVLCQAINVHFMGWRDPSRAEQGLLVFAESQDDINAVDAAPCSDAPTFPHLVEVAR